MTDTLLAAFKKIMSMTDFQTSWLQVAFYGSYFCLAIPAALFIKRFTYKAGVLLGLGLFIIGAVLFYPASKTMLYGHFLAALFILAGGLSILETTANPYILAMGPQESATRRLNLAQYFNPIGSIIGVILSKFFILSNLNTADASARASMSSADLRLVQSEELSAVMGPYVGVAGFLAALWITIAVVRMPRASDVGSDIQIGAAVRRLLSRKHYVLGVVAQFFYVGAQICVWSFTIRYVMQELGLNEDDAATYYLTALVLFTLSRFICTWLMKFVAPGKLLTIMALMAMLFTAIVIVGGGMVGVVALVSISGCMSLMFPTIFGLASSGLEGDRKIGGSGLIMAILGGAVLTMIMGQVSDASGSIKLAFIVPLLCFLIITYYGYQTQRMQVQR